MSEDSVREAALQLNRFLVDEEDALWHLADKHDLRHIVVRFDRGEFVDLEDEEHARMNVVTFVSCQECFIEADDRLLQDEGFVAFALRVLKTNRIDEPHEIEGKRYFFRVIVKDYHAGNTSQYSLEKPYHVLIGNQHHVSASFFSEGFREVSPSSSYHLSNWALVHSSIVSVIAAKYGTLHEERQTPDLYIQLTQRPDWNKVELRYDGQPV